MKDYEGYKVPFMTEKISCLFLFYEGEAKRKILFLRPKFSDQTQVMISCRN